MLSSCRGESLEACLTGQVFVARHAVAAEACLMVLSTALVMADCAPCYRWGHSCVLRAAQQPPGWQHKTYY